MRFGIDVGSELELKLYQAVLLYRNDHGNRVMATVHGVVRTLTNCPPALGAGQLLSTAALRELTKQLGARSQAEYLPENVIARTPELIAWWAPASVRPMFFRDGSELADVSGKLFPHPPLLFAVGNGVLFVRALDQSKRPTADTKLAAAPYWNISTATEKSAPEPCGFQDPLRSARSRPGSRLSFKASSHIREVQAD